MGWSCTAKAGDTLRKMQDKCYANSGCTNVWKDVKGNRYLFEVGDEKDDGRITASVSKFIGDTNFVKRAGSICINPDGTVKNAPKFLKG